MAAAVVLASACVPAAAHAATIHVNTDKDPEAPAPGVCSLREAIIASNTDVAVGGCPAGTSGGNTIELPGGTYVLTIAPTGVDDATTGDLNITAPVKISGAGLATTAIVQTRADRVIDDESAGVQISGVTIRGGYLTTTGDGGAILIGTHAALTLASSELNSDSAAEGGGVFIDPGGKAAIESTTISADRAIYTGGGIVNEGTLTLSGGEVGGTGFASNQAVTGAGITSSGLLTVTGTTIMGNLSQSWGGGLFLSGPTTLTNVQVSDNSSEAEGGGGIAFFSEGSYELDIEGSTIGPNNTALRGGDGVFLGNESIGGFPTIAKLTRSTIAENGNLGSKHGGGLFLEPHTEATLHDVTLAENSAGTMNGDGGNLYAEAESKLRWENSLVANAATGGNCAVPNGSTTSLGGNQEYGDAGDANPTTGCGFTNAAQGDVQLGSDLEPSQLLPLASNGGPTETMALAPGS
ncbi:MAG TPA: CSLREA domain-containing protein, partial [Solirubrobacteraceae bacterium]|nr:CSLREA domain-containing protein [Solirubrobacteraceae bacterium]